MIFGRLMKLPLGLVLLPLLLVPTGLHAQTGDVTGIHDPSIIQADNAFYIFSTGRGIPIHTSTDLFTWKRSGRVFDHVPDWTHTYTPAGNSMWAPDISHVDGEYRLYYAVSAFGKTASAIGLATSKSLDPAGADYRWIDRGKVIDTPEKNRWNAIDPCAVEDADGKAWLVLGSCWTGIKLVALDRRTGLLADPADAPMAIAANPPTNIIEEGYIRRNGVFYYLWVSVDHCCRGAASDYRIKVGRSKTITGPYLDRDGRPMTEGSGTLVLAGHDSARGPGSCAILPFAKHDWLIHHEYDADNGGTPTLQIRQLYWADDGWPVAGEPITRPPDYKPPARKSIIGDWSIRFDFAEPRTITLHEDGSITPGEGREGRWKQAGSSLTLIWSKAAKTFEDQCTVADDGSYFVGRNEDGAVITGTHATRR